MKSFADSLESYMIAEEANIFKDLPAAIKELRQKARGKSNSTDQDNLAARDAAAREKGSKHQQWLSTSEGKACVAYVNRKYGINCLDYSDEENTSLGQKLQKFIKADIIKISKEVNSNKELCKKFATSAQSYYKDGLSEKFVNLIMNGPCSTNPRNWSGEWADNEVAFEVIKLPQDALMASQSSILNYFIKRLNTIYEKEIKVNLISAFYTDIETHGIVICDY